jgi:hypothetical protein
MSEWHKLQLMLEKARNEIAAGDADSMHGICEAIEHYFTTNATYTDEEIQFCQNKLGDMTKLLDHKQQELDSRTREAIENASKHERYLRSMMLQDQ